MTFKSAIKQGFAFALLVTLYVAPVLASMVEGDFFHPRCPHAKKGDQMKTCAAVNPEFRELELKGV